jgi:glycerophosphoryl diester phosphodiesterase
VVIRSLIATLAACIVASAAQAAPADTMRRIGDPGGGIIAIAHRGCHAAAPRRGLGTAPENSRAALLRCAAMGVEVMETDVRRTRDGYLVMVHDEGVDRTTDGKGRVADLTLAQIRALRLRDDEGGADARLTEERVPTLDELLALAKGRVVLNLDVKDAIYAEVVDAVRRAGATDRVIVKTFAGIGSSPLAPMAPYDRVPFAIIPITGAPQAGDVPAIIVVQARGPRKPIAVELPRLPLATLPASVAAARRAGMTVWVNTLFEGFVTDLGGDVEAARDPDAIWGRLADSGVRLIQTDAVEALIDWRQQRSRSTRR